MCSASLIWFVIYIHFAVISWGDQQIQILFPFQLTNIFQCLFQTPYIHQDFQTPLWQKSRDPDKTIHQRNPCKTPPLLKNSKWDFIYVLSFIEYLQGLTEVIVESLLIQWLRESEEEEEEREGEEEEEGFNVNIIFPR